jgi:hypothetical protein
MLIQNFSWPQKGAKGAKEFSNREIRKTREQKFLFISTTDGHKFSKRTKPACKRGKPV